MSFQHEAIIGILLGLGFALMAGCIFLMKGVGAAVAFTMEPDRRWLTWRIRLQWALIVAFGSGYVALLLIHLLLDWHLNEYVVGVILLLEAVFVYLAIIVQKRMAQAMARTISGLVPICAWCKKIRKDAPKGKEGPPEWESVETFVSSRTQADFTHGICPECRKKLDPAIASRGEG
jgi:hypothetical protein